MKKSEKISRWKWASGNYTESELEMELDKSYKQSLEDLKRGNFVSAEDFYRDFEQKHKCTIR